MRQSLKKALSLCFGSEGGYVNRSTDAGGPTKYGITMPTLAAHRGRPVTIDDIKNLTFAEAEAIYQKSFWPQAGGDVLPVGLDYMTFDFGVHSNPTRAIRYLQLTLQDAGVYAGEIDGFIGVQTLRAVTNYPSGPRQLIKDYAERRMKYLRSLTNPKTGFPVNGRGWTIRVTGIDPKGEFKPQPGVVGNALAMYDAAVAANTKGIEPDAELVRTLPIVAPPDSQEKAEPSKPTVFDVIKTPEGMTAAGGVITSLAAAFGDKPILQYGLVAVLVIGAGIAAMSVYSRLKNQQV